MNPFRKTSPVHDLQPPEPDEAREVPIDREELVVVSRPQGREAEQFRRLRNSIQALNADGASRTVLFTSAVEGEGKTVASLNLALALRELPHLSVCVLDANRFHPSVETYLGLERRQGLTEVLAGKLTIEQAVRATSLPRLDVMGAGAETADPVFNVDRVRSVLNALKRRYDYVLVDAPPVLDTAHTSLLAALADGILLVVRIGTTPKGLVEEAYTMLEGLGGNVLGTCAVAANDL